MNKYAVNLLAGLMLFKTAALNAKQCPGSAQPNKNHASLEKQFSQKGWNPCATHHARYVMPLAQTRYQPDWTLFANAANAQPNQPAASAPNKPVQVFQNDPSLPLSKYKEAEKKAFWWGAGTGTASGVLTAVGVYWAMKRIWSIPRNPGLGDIFDVWVSGGISAFGGLAGGSAAYFFTNRAAKKHYIEKFAQEQKTQ